MEKKHVEASEQEVRIDFNLGCKCRTNISLKSLNQTTPIAFKVQTSSPQKFLVNPPNGLIPPSSSISFQVILKPQTQLPSSFPRSHSDRFLIKAAPAPDLETSPLHTHDLNRWFANTNQPIQDIKLKVLYVGPFLLHHSVASAEIDTVRSMIKRQKSIVAHLSPQQSMKLLEAASSSGSVNMLTLLLEAGLRLDGSPGPQLAQPTNQEVEPKHDGKALLSNITHKEDKDNEAGMKKKGWTPLHVAATSDREDVMATLIQENAREDDDNKGGVDCRDKEGRTPLHLAASKGAVQCARMLVEAGASRNATSNDGRTALFRAAANGHLEMVRLLLDVGADPTINNNHGRSPLDVARDKGHKEIIDILERGELVLTAARRGDSKQLESLLSKGVYMKHCDQYGLTALHVASIKGHTDIVAMLIEYGMDLECQDLEGHTPLHLAVEGGSVETVGVLINKGANFNARSKRGATPFYMATSMGYDAISQLLQSKGATTTCLASSSSSLSSSSLN
ncbi:ankyrin repeat, PH and SEC7 domain-containing protein [Cinnamomum micranthum f. kanehirae]|uniref:Ankyrin repeat, PH and SEC7 domain-containing protein n=1 Tax=Cinnamomum micranthum f. kanehirae TaxID=337451 RepID=A0A443NK62_9MAGN|nr:ankyrin repeat, PH and SEC7 domain-containing protein [Cinnamomum micranthum f. kanehirae]